MKPGVVLLLAIVGGAIAAYTTVLLVGGALLGVLWLWVFGDDPWPRWVTTSFDILLPVVGLVSVGDLRLADLAALQRVASRRLSNRPGFFAFLLHSKEEPMSSATDTAPQNAVLRYSNTAVALHWITVVLVLLQAYLGFTFGLSEPSPARDEIFIWHKSVGVVILIAALVRLAYRWKNPPPPFPPELPAWERAAAVWNHRLFYALLIAMPIVGFVAVSGFANGRPRHWSGAFRFR